MSQTDSEETSVQNTAGNSAAGCCRAWLTFPVIPTNLFWTFRYADELSGFHDLEMPASPSALVFADDLTGLIDLVAPLAGRGLRATAGFSGSFDFGRPDEPAPDLAGVNTATRHLPPDLAAEKLRAALEEIASRSPEILYKKTDSTLRGNIAAELAMVRERFPGIPLFYAPGFPEVGRTVIQGRLLVDGVLVEDTALAADPLSPVRESHVANLLRTHLQEDIREVDLGSVRRGDWADPHFTGVTVFDTETPEDLDRIADALAQIPQRPLLLSGPSGLSRRLPQLLARASRETPVIRKIPRPALVISGSVTPRTCAQVRRGLAGDFCAIRLQPGWLEDLPGDQAERLKEQARQASRQGLSVLFYSAVAPADYEAFLEKGRELGIHGAQLAEKVLALQTSLGTTLFQAADWPTITLFGGETADHFLRATGITSARVLGELHPGVGLMSCVSRGRDITLITKSGGFGPENLLETLWK